MELSEATRVPGNLADAMEMIAVLRTEVCALWELVSTFADWYVPDSHECENGMSKEYCGRCMFEAAALRQTVDVR